jgi:rhamnogalacturonyl hydrolase YesR
MVIWSEALAATLMARYPDPNSFPWRSWCYPQAFMLLGMARLWKSTGNARYYDYIRKYVDRHVDAEGNIADYRGNSLDDIMPGSIIAWAYQQTGKVNYKLAADKIRETFDSYPRSSDGSFFHNKSTANFGEVWVDGLFMGQMFLTRYGKYVGDAEYCFNEAAKQITAIERRLRKGDSGLLYHAWDEDKIATWASKETGLSPEVWSEGLGWYALILVETLDVFPLNHPQRGRIVELLGNLIEGLRRTQDPVTGLWYQVVDKGYLADNWQDTSGSAMFVYAIKRAIELGVADAAVYDAVAQKGYQGITSNARLNDAGLVDILDACDGLCVQDSYDIYINYPRKINAKEAVAAFFWATWIMEKTLLQQEDSHGT